MDSHPTSDPLSIEIAGAAGILRDIDSIEIPAEDIASGPISSNIHKLISIEKYLPDGAYLTDTSEENITVYVRVSKKPEKADESDTSEGASADASGGET